MMTGTALPWHDYSYSTNYGMMSRDEIERESVARSNMHTWFVCRRAPEIAQNGSQLRHVLTVRLSVRVGQLGSRWTDFHEILHFRMFKKSVEKI